MKFIPLFLASLICFFSNMDAISFQDLKNNLGSQTQRFNYPLELNIIRGGSDDENVLLCCHGYASDSSLANIIASYKATDDHVVGFNFPDYLIYDRGFDYNKVCYGTPYELAPALILLKALAVDANVKKISLYGFSAGGGAIINILATLNSTHFDHYLGQWGITVQDKSTIIQALQNGVILLDAPLKSKEEISDFRGSDPQSDFLAKRYRDYNMSPIEVLGNLKGLKLTVVVFFQNPDEALTNRDDLLYAKRLKEANSAGTTKVIIANEGGHCGFHKSLWKAFKGIEIERKKPSMAL